MTKVAPQSKIYIQQDVFNKVDFRLGLAFAAGSSRAQFRAFLGEEFGGATEGNYKMHKLTAGVTECLVPFFLSISDAVEFELFKDFSVGCCDFINDCSVFDEMYPPAADGSVGLEDASRAGESEWCARRSRIVARNRTRIWLSGKLLFAAVFFMAVRRRH